MLEMNSNTTVARGLVPRRLNPAATNYKKKKLLLPLPIVIKGG